MTPKERAAGGLAGKVIVVTRPSAQAAGLAGAIEANGGSALLVPALEIRGVENPRPLFGIFDRLENFDLAVFISPNAVHRTLDLMLERRAAGWPQNLRVAAIGRVSRRELRRRGITEVIAPTDHADSEALLALPDLEAMAGKRVVIFRGEGGRDLLGNALSARGATVEYAECYRRVRPPTDCAPLLAAWTRGEVDAVTVSSAEGLANFYEMIGKPGQQWMQRTPLFVSHERVAGEAAALGAGSVRVAGPGDAEVVAALVAYFRDAK